MSKIKRNRLQFLQWLHADGAIAVTGPDGNKTTAYFSRNYLRTVAMKNGMAWAPAWIVKDKSRNTSRGLYEVPEYASYLAELGTNAPNSSTGTAQGVIPNMAGSV